MKLYNVNLTPKAKENIKDTIYYISHVLNEPQNARNFLDFIEKEIKNLNYMPSSHQLVDEEPFHSKGVRKINIKKFIAYFVIDEKNYVVWILAFAYSGSLSIAKIKNINIH